MRKKLYILIFILSILSMQGWSQSGTAGRNVTVIDTAFKIPELGRTRRIWIYIPEHSGKERFPVMYLQDGQNLFDRSTSFAGEWGIDEFMDTVSLPKCIIVGIDNGGSKRINEYSPYDMEKYGKGEGGSYLHFLVKELKPFIDKHYPTKKCRKNTLIGGSSMGALIAFYALLNYPRKFGSAAVFSPAFWIAPSLIDDTKKLGKKLKCRVYFYAGKHESETMVPEMLKIMEAVSKFRKVKATAVIREEGKHNEATWRNEFPLYYKWQFGEDH